MGSYIKLHPDYLLSSADFSSLKLLAQTRGWARSAGRVAPWLIGLVPAVSAACNCMLARIRSKSRVRPQGTLLRMVGNQELHCRARCPIPTLPLSISVLYAQPHTGDYRLSSASGIVHQCNCHDVARRSTADSTAVIPTIAPALSSLVGD